MKDLEIRGAGDLLGGEQSGFINDIGFDTYQKILNEAIEELKENEFADLYKGKVQKPKEFVKEIQIDTDFELLLPDDYISIISERLNLYSELSELNTIEELIVFEQHLIDRFGELPKEAKELLQSVQVKWLAKNIGLERLILKKGKMIGYFVSDQQSPYYQTETFTKVLQFVQQNMAICKMKEKETKQGLRLLLTFDKINSIDKALQVLSRMET